MENNFNTCKLLPIMLLIISVKCFSMELVYSGFSIYSSGKEESSNKKLELNSEYLDLTYSKQKYVSEDFNLDPDEYELKLKTDYYELSINEVKLNFNNLQLDDEIIELEGNRYNYIEHTFKIPSEEFELQLNFGNSVEKTYKLTSNIANVGFSDYVLVKYGYSFKYKNFLFANNLYQYNAILLLNDISDIGEMEGKTNEVFLKYKNSKITYRKINFNFSFGIDQYSAALISALSDKYLYGELDIDVENLDLENSFEFEFKSSKIIVRNNFGVIMDKGSSISYLEEYYTEHFSFGFWRVRSPSRDVERTYELENKNIYYDTVNFNYEKYINQLTFGVSSFITVIKNLSLKESEIELDYEESEESYITTTKKKDIFVLPGITLYVKYEF